MKKPWNRKRAQQARDIGIYTMIPTMLVVGPVLGYFLGHWAGGRWGHVETYESIGLVLGLVASFRQIYLLFKQQGGRK